MEKVRLFQRMLENLYAITPPTRKFVKEYFSQMDRYWFDTFILPELNTDRRYTVDNLKEVDILALLKALITNWDILRQRFPGEEKFKNKQNLVLLKSVRKIRGYVAHIDELHYTFFDEFENDEKTINDYAIFLDTTLDDCKRELYEDENKQILNFVLEKVVNQAIDLEVDFPPDVIASIKHTKEILKSKKTAKEIIDFIEYALENSRGKEVAEVIHEHGLESFEDIAVQIREMYYGFVSEK